MDGFQLWQGVHPASEMSRVVVRATQRTLLLQLGADLADTDP